MKYLAFLIFIISFSSLEAQDYSIEWSNELRANPDAQELSDLTSFLNYDLSHLWLYADEEKANIGYIGDDFQRFYFHIDGIYKDSNNPANYIMHGRTMVKKNICKFDGYLKIASVMLLKAPQRENIKQGYALCDYVLFENPFEKHSGKFNGKAAIYFYIDAENKIWYDDLEPMEPYYCNNVFVGVWQKYESVNIKPCIWGQNRIPYTFMLDSATEGRLIPSEDFLEKGWKRYKEDYINETNIENNWWR